MSSRIRRLAAEAAAVLKVLALAAREEAASERQVQNWRKAEQMDQSREAALCALAIVESRATPKDD